MRKTTTVGALRRTHRRWKKWETAEAQPAAQPEKFDVVAFVMAYEAGELNYEYDKMIAGFQRMVNDGTVWSLQGHYGRTAQNLIDRGLITDPRKS